MRRCGVKALIGLCGGVLVGVWALIGWSRGLRGYGWKVGRESGPGPGPGSGWWDVVDLVFYEEYTKCSKIMFLFIYFNYNPKPLYIITYIS